MKMGIFSVVKQQNVEEKNIYNMYALNSSKGYRDYKVYVIIC